MSDKKSVLEEQKSEAEKRLAALEHERRALNERRAEAAAQDQEALASAWDEYQTEVKKSKRGKPTARRPVAVHTAKAGVEERAQELPKKIDEARLEVRRPERSITSLERGQVLKAQEVPREQVERIDREIEELRKERAGWQNELDGLIRREGELQSREAELDMEIGNLERAVDSQYKHPWDGV